MPGAGGGLRGMILLLEEHAESAPLSPGYEFLPVYKVCISFMAKLTELKPIVSIIKSCVVCPLKQHCL